MYLPDIFYGVDTYNYYEKSKSIVIDKFSNLNNFDIVKETRRYE